MEKRCFTQSTWIDSKVITFERKKKVYKVEISKVQPRKKLRQKNPARLKTEKGNLSKR